MMSSKRKGAEDPEKAEIESIDYELSLIETEIEKLKTQKGILLDRKNKLKELIQQRKSEKLSNRNWSVKTFPWSAKVDAVLKESFNLSEFRPFQLEVINATLSKEDVILIMPTGGGKSLCYQLPALIDKGITLVVSPLVSLMEDQIIALKKINYPAIMLSASSKKEDLQMATSALKDPSSKIKLIYVTPEKLAKSKRFMSQLQKCYEQGRFSRLAVDEVHCCSAWGHDFRPDYGYLGILKDMFPGVPLLGLTATSTSKVTADVQKMLNIQGCLIIKATFNRPNLYYEVVLKPPGQNEALDLLESWLKNKFRNKTGIIYTTAIKDCEELAKELRKREIRAGIYHAMLEAPVRSKMHTKWMSGDYQVIVATIAFGMGIDKPDVRFVIHHTLSKSMENFYQESGRAGRDGETAHCIVMFRLADLFKLSTMVNITNFVALPSVQIMILPGVWEKFGKVFTQQTGLENLYGMLNYCLDSRTCRRSLIAEHFDEVWNTQHCNGMCDHCRHESQLKKIDATPHCRELYKLISRAHEVDVKLTALKLVDAWFGKGDSKLRISGVKCTLNKITAEKIIGYLLVRGYLKEDFHYTAYSTISYLKKGPKASALDNSNHTIILEFSSGSIKKNSSDVIQKNDESEEEVLIVSHTPKGEKRNYEKSPEKSLKRKKESMSSPSKEISCKKVKD